MTKNKTAKQKQLPSGSQSKSSGKKEVSNKASTTTVANKKPRITLQDVLQDKDNGDDSSSSSELPPEDEWDVHALSLKASIESGAFDHLLESKGGDERSESGEDCFEEVELDDSDAEEEGVADEDEESEQHQELTAPNHRRVQKEKEVDISASEDEGSLSEGSSEKESDSDEKAEHEGDKRNEENDESDDEEGDEEDSGQEEEDKDDKQDERKAKLVKQNNLSSRALHVVTEELQSRKRDWPWAETFDILSTHPLPFSKHNDVVEPVDIHDDLKREVAFYDMALSAVALARERCVKAKIPFSRPDDFFAEMVKTDDHMAKVKDRLIFENKKIEAVANRKSNKEHKLRAKEAHSNKLAEKAKRKREHFKNLDDWAQSAVSKRGRLLDDDDDDAVLRSMGQRKGPTGNKKRLAADKKYGFGGKQGRFKQSDRKTLNDTSSFNPRGNFAGGMKKTAKSSSGGKKRQGKRARDANRAKR